MKSIKVLQTTKNVVENSESVSINRDCIVRFCNNFHPKNVKHWIESSNFDFSHLNKEEKLNFILLFNSLSFCYWGSPKWTIKYGNKSLDGAFGMITALKRALEEGKPILDSKYLSTISRKDLANILRGNVTILLFSERVKILREVGGLLEKHNGKFSDLIKREKEATKIVGLIADNLPSFKDVSVYNGKRVYFLKRAQLTVWDIYQVFNGKDYGSIKNIDLLTGLADYKLPFLLRKLGILKYTDKLSNKIDNGIRIKHNSKDEIEIRANTIWAIELIKKEVNKRYSKITAMDINDYLWLSSQNRLPSEKYHLTVTTCY